MAVTGLVIPTVKPAFTEVATGILGSEGPVFDTNGAFYMVAPEEKKDGNPAGQIISVNLSTGQKTLLCEPEVNGYGGIPAGCQCDKQNNLWVADMRLGLLKVSLDGKFQQVATQDSEGRTMQGCNDCAFDYNGNLWITAPAGSIAPHPFRKSFNQPFGSVYCYTTDGKMIRIDTGIQFPNGIAVLHSDDGHPRKLIVAETPAKHLWGYDIQGPGKVTGKKPWGILPGKLEGGPDGMDFDESNYLLSAHWGSSHIEVFGPGGGNPQLRVECPFAKISNLQFTPGGKTVYVTEHDGNALWKFDWQRKGKPQYCET